MSYILFGSQTGQAKAIAENTLEVINRKNEIFKLFELDEIDKSYFFKTADIVIIICSTTGDGDAPENAARFTRKIKSYMPNTLCHLKYTVLGLGDTNYSNFCNCGKTIDSTLNKTGALRFYNSKWADDAVGLENVVEPWLEGLYKVLSGHVSDILAAAIENVTISEILEPISVSGNKLLGDEEMNNINEFNLSVPLSPVPFLHIDYQLDAECVPADCVVSSAPLPAAKTALRYACVNDVRRVTARYAIKAVHHVTLCIIGNDEESGQEVWQWSPGDSIGVLPCNSTAEVEAILSRLAVSHAQAHYPLSFSVLTNTQKKNAKVPEHLEVTGASISLYSVLSWLCDIRAPLSKSGLRAMADYCPPGSPEQRRLLLLCSSEGKMLYLKCIREPCLPLLDLLNWFPSSTIPIERLLELLPRLKARAYSLCDCDTISFAFSKVDIAPVKAYRMRPLTGVCTTWLESMATSRDTPPPPPMRTVPIYLRKNLNGFTVTSAHHPHILIGPGTGVSPFIGFLQYFEKLRKKGDKIGPIWLFFGCRNEAKDFIFKEQMEYFLSENVLTHLCVCFSRDDRSRTVVTNERRVGVCVPKGCKYVQDCLMHHCEELTSLVVDDGARIFVCGDAAGLAKDVLSAWSNVLLAANHSAINGKKEADGYIARMRLNRLYTEDVWL